MTVSSAISHIHTRASWKAAIFFGPSCLTTMQAVTLTHTNCNARHSSSVTWHRCTVHSTTGCPLCSCADETKQCRRGNGPQEKRMLCQLPFNTQKPQFLHLLQLLLHWWTTGPGHQDEHLYIYIYICKAWWKSRTLLTQQLRKWQH